MLSCPFCSPKELALCFQTDFSIAFRDSYPISLGHTLIIPKRHVMSFFELTPEEQMDLIQVANHCKKELDVEFQPNGYNLGINDGKSAGQTIMHVHLHLIPRYSGDSPDPRGGIRWIFPEKAIYWEQKE